MEEVNRKNTKQQAYNFVEYDEKTDTYFIRLTGDSPKYTVDQRIAFMAASEDMYEACQNVYEAHRAGLPRLMESVIETMVRPALSKAKGDK